MQIYTVNDVKNAIGNSTLFNRGHEYAKNGCVINADENWNGDVVTVVGMVKSDSSSTKYKTQFKYDQSKNLLSDMYCNCPAYNNYGTCKHVSALMIAYLWRVSAKNLKEEMERRAVEREELAAQNAEKKRLRDEEKKKREEENRKNYEQSLRQAQISYSELLRKQEQERKRAEQEKQQREHDEIISNLIIGVDNIRLREREDKNEKLHLYPYLSIVNEYGSDEFLFGLRIAKDVENGLTHQYIVRSLREFSDHSMQRKPYEYGKALTFSHCEEDVAEEDRTLFLEINRQMSGIGRSKCAEVILRNIALDSIMRLLIGRKVDLRGEDGQFVPVSVTAGIDRIGIELHRKKNSNGAIMLVRPNNTILGEHGAYFILRDQNEIRCAFGSSFTIIGGLLHLAEKYPDGIDLTKEQLAAVCTRVLKPAEQYLDYIDGRKLLEMNSPMDLTARFLIDTEDKGAISCRVEFHYGDKVFAPINGNTDAADKTVLRDEFAEHHTLSAVESLFTEKNQSGDYLFNGDEDRIFELLDNGLKQLKPYGEVMVSDRLANITVKQTRKMQFGVTPSGGQLIMNADLGGFTQEELQDALAAYRQKRRFVRLKDGTFLSDEALTQAAETAQVIENLDVSADELVKGAKLPAVRAMYIETALGERENIELNISDELTTWTKRFRMAQQTRVGQPSALNAELRDYQLVGLSWLGALDKASFGGILADDMGLGKTVQALALLLRVKENGGKLRAMVVCPASLQINWQRECQRFTPDIKTGVILGSAGVREREIASIESDGIELLITSYDQLKRDIVLYHGVHFTHMIIDEAQNIKNIATQATKAVKLIDADHKIAMTGTPIENRLSELWSIFDFLMPGYLYTYKRFHSRFEMPIVKQEDEKARDNLRQMVSPFILRRLKKDVLTDLPEKVETVMTSELTDEQRKQYAAYASKIISEAAGGTGSPQDRIRILAGLTRLRQICCDPRLCLDGYKGGSAKFEQCLELIQEVTDGGHHILLFSQFTSMLDILESELDRLGISTFILTGETDKLERQRLADEFNAGAAQVFLISLKAGGTGLNLIGADVVIHYDPWWNTATQNQATDRAHRIGQTRGVQVFQLVAKDTIEERIINLQVAKKQLSDSILESGDDLFSVDADTLVNLLKEDV